MIKKGQIFYIDKSIYETGAIANGRPAIIVSPEEVCEKLHTVQVVYLSVEPKYQMDTHVPISETKTPAYALCEQITTVDRARVGDYIGECSPEEVEEINKALLKSIGCFTEVETGDCAEHTAEMVVKDADCITAENAHVDEPKDSVVPTGLAGALAERDVYKRLYEDLINKLFDKGIPQMKKRRFFG